MSTSIKASLGLLFLSALPVFGANQCYYAKDKAGPSNLVPCTDDEESPCCLSGDTCFSGGICGTSDGILYQYGCTDSTFESASCPFKCGWDDTLSPWSSVQYCNDIDQTWICQSPESCGCEWEEPYNLTNIGSYKETRTCEGMGSSARVALYAPPTLVPYVLLPTSKGGSTGYFTPAAGTDGTTRYYTKAGYVPTNVTQYVPAYSEASPTSVVLAEANLAAATSATATATGTATGTATSSSSSSSASATASPSPGLSTGAKAGIGAGVGGGVLAIAIIAFLCWRLYKQRHSTATTQTPQSSQLQPPPGTYHPSSYQQQMPHHSTMPSSQYAYSPIPHGQQEWNAPAFSPNGTIPPGYAGQGYPFQQDNKVVETPVSELPVPNRLHELDSGNLVKK